MALTPDDELPFEQEDPTPVVAPLTALLEVPGCWANLVPEVVEGHDPPPRNLVASLFSARGDAVPLATITAPSAPGGRRSLGIQHGSGPKALDRLAEAGLPLPDRWLKAADHPRRGLVVTCPGDADVAEVVGWLLTAAGALSTVPLTGSWLARLYRP